jgi:hypothetical protein
MLVVDMIDMCCHVWVNNKGGEQACLVGQVDFYKIVREPLGIA